MVVVIASALGPGAVLASRLERDVRRDLRARDASVRVVAGPLAIAQGRLSRLSVSARGAVLDGVSLDEVTLDLRGVTIDAGRAFGGDLVVRRVERGAAELVVSEESLRRYLTDRGGIRNAGVRMDGGVLTVTGQATVLNALVEIMLRAGLVVRDGRQLALDVQQLRVSGLEVPRDLGNVLADSINPILTAPTQPVPVRLTGVTVDGGLARITGEVAP